MGSDEPNVARTTATSSTPGAGSKSSVPSNYYPIWVAVAVGGIFSAILPAVVIIWRIDACSYGLNQNYSGVFVCLPPFVIFGMVVGAVIGIICRWLARLLQAKSNISHLSLISSITAGFLAAAAALIISLIPAFMFAFPDC